MEDEFHRVVEKAKKYDKLVGIYDGLEELHCSFCHHGQSNVSKLIAGKNVYICNYCVELCVEIIKEEGE